MSAVREFEKTTGEILTQTLINTVTLAQQLAELLNQVARLARMLEEHRATGRGSFRRKVR